MNYTEIREIIKTWSENDDPVFLGNIDNFIRLAENNIAKSVRLPGFVKIATGSFQIANALVPVPEDFLSLEYFWINGGVNPLAKKDQSFLIAAYKQIGSGPPRLIAQVDDAQLIVAPPPDQAYSFSYRYYAKPPSLVDEPNGTYISKTWERALVYGSLKEAAEYMKAEDNTVTRYDKEYMSAIGQAAAFARANMKQKNEKTSSSVEVPQ